VPPEKTVRRSWRAAGGDGIQPLLHQKYITDAGPIPNARAACRVR
jgi:hypothetical protein